MVKKIISIVIICSICLCLNAFNPVFANNNQEVFVTVSSADDIITGANGFVTEGEKKVSDTMKEDTLKETSDTIYNILLAIAMITAVAVGIAIGIKFMMASASEKAEVKELLWPYVLGCIVVFGAMGIWKLAVTIFSGF